MGVRVSHKRVNWRVASEESHVGVTSPRVRSGMTPALKSCGGRTKGADPVGVKGAQDDNLTRD